MIIRKFGYSIPKSYDDEIYILFRIVTERFFNVLL